VKHGVCGVFVLPILGRIALGSRTIRGPGTPCQFSLRWSGQGGVPEHVALDSRWDMGLHPLVSLTAVRLFEMIKIPIALVVIASLLGTTCRAQDVLLVHADGRRENATAPRKDAKGEWSVECEGRRTVVHGGEVVAIVDANGKETAIIPVLTEAPDSPESVAALAGLRDPKNKTWEPLCEQLAKRPSRGVHEALVKLAGDPRKELRSRAMTALAWLRTKESALALAAAVLAEKDPGLHRDAASGLFAVEEILRRSDSAELLTKGLQDKDATVRIIFATLAPPDDAVAAEVLRKDGLKHSDHHMRESVAQELGERGDGSGEGILIGLLSRTKVPALSGDAEFDEKLMAEGQARACFALGKIGSATARSALSKATASRFLLVQRAATKALAAAPK
jgi:hypothetical protein